MSSAFDDLLVALGFEYDPEAAEKFSNDLQSLVGLATNVAKTVVGATVAIVGFTAATTAASDEQGKLADEIGVAVEQIDALQFANRRAGGTADGMAASLQSLSSKIGEAARGTGSGIEAFGMLGVEVQNAAGQLKSADQVILEVADSMKGFSKGQQIELAEKLGLSGSIRLLQQGRQGIAELTAEANAFGTTTAEDARLSAEFQDSLTDIWQIVKQLSRVVTRSLVPVLEKAANTFTEWWKTNKAIIEQNIPIYIEKTVQVIKLLGAALAAIIALRFATLLFTLINMFKGLSVWALAANASIMLLPVLIASIIAGIALLAEDAKVFFEGGESFIGNMIKQYPQWEEELVAVAAVFATLYDLTTMIFDGWGKIFDFFSSGTVLEDFKLVLKQIGLDINEMFFGLGRSISEVFDRALQKVKDRIAELSAKVKDLFSFDIPNPLESIFGKDYSFGFSNPLESIFGKELNFATPFNFDSSALDFNFDEGEKAVVSNLAKKQSSEVLSSGAGSTESFSAPSIFSASDAPRNITKSNTTTLTGDVNITVEGSVSPENTAIHIRNEFKNILEQSSTNLNSPVDL